MMKKLFILCLVIMILINTNAVLAESVVFEDIIQGDIRGITVKDIKQPNVVWDLPYDDIDEVISLFKAGDLKTENYSEESTQKYIMYIYTYDGNTSISIYDNGFISVGKNTKKYSITNFDSFSNGLNRLLSTQSKGYGNSMPSKQLLVEVSDWASSTYRIAVDNDLIPEYMKVGYMTDNITREQFCDLISILLRKQSKQDITENLKPKFQDTTNTNVSYLVEKNIINGKSDINFSPNDFLTREEAATILWRILCYLDLDVSDNNNEYLYHDDANISDWAKNSVYEMNRTGVMIGTQGHTFSPQNTFSKEQAITTALRIFDKYIEELSE